MKTELIEELKALDAYYWWHVSKRKTILNLIKRNGGTAGKKALEIGFGSATLLKDLQRLGAECWGVDTSEAAVRFAREAGIERVTQGDFEKGVAGIPEGYFDYVILADVLEHVDNDVEFLKRVRGVLSAGGKCIMTVPAFGFLWTYWDDILGHRRRYALGGLISAVRGAGLAPLFANYYYFAAFFPAFIIRLVTRVTRRRGKTEFFAVPGFVNRMFIWICDAERAVFGRMRLPAGLSVVCVAGRKDA